MKNLEVKVKNAEELCRRTLDQSRPGLAAPPGVKNVTGSPTPSWKVNPDAVEKCVYDVVRIAKELSTDESRYFKAVSSYITQHTHNTHNAHTLYTHTMHTVHTLT